MSEQKTDASDEKLEQAFEQIESGQRDDSPHKEKTPARNSSGGGGSVLAIMLALIAIGIASWPAFEVYKQQQQTIQVDPMPGRVAQLESGLQALGDELGNLNITVSATSDKINAQIAASESKMQRFQTGVSEAVVSIQSQMGTSSQDWVYAEVEYLVRMANQRVLMEGDATSAVQLLESADEIIRETDGLTAHSLREALARDIAALKAVNSPDLQGIYLELSALISQVPALQRPLPTYQPKIPEVSQDSTASGYLAQFLGLVRLAGSKLANLVDFRRDTVEIKRILPPQEEYFLRQNLILKLQIAQMALLEGNDEVFQSALEDASKWVTDSFDETGPGAVAMVEALNRLSGAVVSVDLPDIAGSLEAARLQMAGFKEASPQ